MTQTELFKFLGAPLANTRWSWGAARASDGAVILRVWQDRKRKIDGKWYMELTNHDAYPGNDSDPGFLERLRHVEQIRAGAKTFMVTCEAKDPAAQPRDIRSFNEREVLVGGEIVEADGDWWLEQVGRMSVREARGRPTKAEVGDACDVPFRIGARQYRHADCTQKLSHVV